MSWFLRRLRKLAGLIESIADDPYTNARIERELESFRSEFGSDDEFVTVRDLLETLKDAPHGLTQQEWIAKVRRIHDDPELPLDELINRVAGHFSWLVREQNGRWMWMPAPAAGYAPDDGEDDPHYHDAMKQKPYRGKAEKAATRDGNMSFLRNLASDAASRQAADDLDYKMKREWARQNRMIPPRPKSDDR